MGKFLTLMVGAIILGSSYLLLSGQRATFETREQQSDYQYKGIASGIVQSGFNRGVSAIQRDLMDVSETFERVTMADGYYDLQVTKNSYGDLDVAVNAHSGDAEYDIESSLIFTASLPAAFMIDDDGVVFSGSGFYQISGVDRRMPAQGTGSGFDDPVRGIMSTETHLAEITGSLQMNQVVGIGTQPEDPVNLASVASGFSKADFEALYQEAVLAAHSVLGADPNGNVSESAFISAVSSSSASNPQIVRALGNVTVTGTLQGYGMLLIEDGGLVVSSSDFDWEGLIMIRKQFVDTVDISLSNTTLHGGLIAYDVDASGFGCPADFDIVGDEAVVNDSFTVDITVLGAAIVSGEYDQPVTARINIGGQSFEPWGSYDLALDGNVNTGNSGITYSWESTTVFPPGSIVSIDGRSWTHKDTTVTGTLESDWEVHMEANSSTAGPQIYLLEHTDPVPNVGGFEGQYSVVEFLDDYIENDHLVLDAGQAVSLFEIGVTDESSAAFDLQDLVVLITMNRAGSGVCNLQGASSMFDVDINGGTQIHYSLSLIHI